MARVDEIRGLAEFHAERYQQFTDRLDELSGYCSQTVSLSIYASAFDSCTASTCNRLCVAGIME